MMMLRSRLSKKYEGKVVHRAGPKLAKRMHHKVNFSDGQRSPTSWGLLGLWKGRNLQRSIDRRRLCEQDNQLGFSMLKRARIHAQRKHGSSKICFKMQLDAQGEANMAGNSSISDRKLCFLQHAAVDDQQTIVNRSLPEKATNVYD